MTSDNWFFILWSITIICIVITEIILAKMREKAEKKKDAARMRFIRTELVPEIQDAILETIVEANEESMEMIPGKLKDIRREIERE